MNFKLLLFIGMSVLMIASCKKQDNDEPLPSQCISEEDIPTELIIEYGLTDPNIKYEAYILGSDTTLIFFNGRKDKKLWIGCYNRQNKDKIFSWCDENHLDTIFTINAGYGELSIYKVDNFAIRSAHKYNDEYVLIIQGTGNIEETASNLILSEIRFINDLTPIKLRSEIPAWKEHFDKIIPWYENTIIVVSSNRIYSVYTTKGEKLFDAIKPIGKELSPISVEQYIMFSGETSGTFNCLNIKSGELIWESLKPLEDLETNTRIDKILVSKNDDDYLIYTFKYTFYSGKSEERKIKINIKTGEFTKQ